MLKRSIASSAASARAIDAQSTPYAGEKTSRERNTPRLRMTPTKAAVMAPSAEPSAGWSPSVRLFEAAAIGTPIVSDAWPGLDAFFVPGKEILIAEAPRQGVRRFEPRARRFLQRIG